MKSFHNKQFALFCLLALFSLGAYGAPVVLSIRDGVEGNLRSRIEQNASTLLSRINQAYEANSTGLDLAQLEITDQARLSLAALWENVHFMCEEEEIVEYCIQTGNGYQVRQIPLTIQPQGGVTQDDPYQEAVISFDTNGRVSSFYFTIGINLYAKVMKNKEEVGDVRRRMQILDYVEQFRTAYNQKDLAFLEQVFSDDALIITGKVVKSIPSDVNHFASSRVEFKKQTKQEYLHNLKNCFARNKYIQVKFDEISVMRHDKKPDFYGVQLHQLYASSTYSDDGYLFLLWDFRNEDQPQIHVRTWQPKYTDASRKQVATSPDDVFSIGDFKIDL